MLIQHSLYYSVAKLLPATINLFAVILFTRLLTTGEYGRYAIVLTGTLLVYTVFYEWLCIVIKRFLPSASNKENYKSIKAQIYTLYLIVVTITVVSTIILLFFIKTDYRNYLVFGALITIFFAQFQLLASVYMTSFFIQKYGLLQIFKSVLCLILSLVFIWIGYKELSLLLGMLCSLILSPLCMEYKKITKINFQIPSLTTTKTYLSYGMPLIATLGLLWILTSMDRILIGFFLGEEQVGIYAVGYDLAKQSIGLILVIIATASFPIIVTLYENEKNDILSNKIENSAQLYLVFGLSSCAYVYALANIIADVIVGENFRDGVTTVLPWAAFIAFIAGLKSHYYDLVFHLTKKTNSLFKIALIASLSNLLLNIFMIPTLGIQGALLATLIAYILSALASAFIGKKLFVLPKLYRFLPSACILSISICIISYLFSIYFEEKIYIIFVSLISYFLVIIVGFYYFDYLGFRCWFNRLVNRFRYKNQ